MKRFLALVFLLLAACAPTPQAAMERVNAEFAGRDVNDFFADYGSPASSQALGDDGGVYCWLSLEPHGGARTASAITYPSRHFGDISGTGNGETITGYCEIRIRTDVQEKIVNLALVYDSIGKYSGSRCAEIFSQPPN